MQLFLIRHPRPEVAPGVCYGRLDLPLAAGELANSVRRLQQILPPDLPVFSSPLQRCRALAAALAPAPQLLAALQEIDFGTWEGQEWSAIARQEIDAWAADLLHYRPPGGESVAELAARVSACLDALAQQGIERCVVVSHAGPIRAALGQALALPASAWTQLAIAYGACVSINWPHDGGSREGG